jgi:hypothetical protein
MEQKVSCHVHKSLAHLLTKDQMSALQSYHFKIQFNIMIPSTPRSSKWSFSGFYTKIVYAVSTPPPPPNTCHASHPFQPPLFGDRNNV